MLKGLVLLELPQRPMSSPLFRIVTQKRANGEVNVSVRYSETLRYLPVTERERAIYEASCSAHERVLEAFEESTQRVEVA